MDQHSNDTTQDKQNDQSLAELLGEIFLHGDVALHGTLADAIKKHAVDDLELISPLLSADVCLYSNDIIRIVDRSRTWLLLADEVERKLKALSP